jgi:Type-IV b secretion system, inner-membrane complex component
MGSHGLETVLKRNQFYYQNYRLLGLLIFLLGILLLSLLTFSFYQRSAWPKPKYFATTPDGVPIPIVSLDQPLYEDPNAVLNWSARAVIAIYSLDYVNWRKTLQDAEAYFTLTGYQAFLAALQASTNLEAIKAKRQVVSVEIRGAPQLTRQGQLDPTVPYTWDIAMPVTLTYQNSENEVIKQVGTILMQIERTSLLRYKEGIAIAQLVLQTQ